MGEANCQRYQIEKQDTTFAVWRFNHKCHSISAGKIVRLETLAPALVHWGVNGWLTPHDAETRNSGLGIYLTDLPTQALPSGTLIDFTFYWPGAGRWENVDFGARIQ